MNKQTYIITLPLLLLLCFVMGCTENKRPLSPQQKLQNEITELENVIAASEYGLRQSEIEIQQKKANIPFEVAKAVNEAKSIGMNVEDARTDTIRQIKEDLQIEEVISKAEREVLKEEKQRLAAKKAQLQSGE